MLYENVVFCNEPFSKPCRNWLTKWTFHDNNQSEPLLEGSTSAHGVKLYYFIILNVLSLLHISLHIDQKKSLFSHWSRWQIYMSMQELFFPMETANS